MCVLLHCTDSGEKLLSYAALLHINLKLSLLERLVVVELCKRVTLGNTKRENATSYLGSDNFLENDSFKNFFFKKK